MIVRLTALDPRVWVKNESNIQQLGIFRKLYPGVVLIDPAQIASLGGSKSSQLSDSDFLSLRLAPSLDVTASASSHLNSSWSSNGWTVGDLQTFLKELKTWCENHFGVSIINQNSGDVNLVLMQGQISNDSENTYTVALAYFGNRGITIGDALPVEGGLLIHLDAASITGVSDGGGVTSWTPKAGSMNGEWTAAAGLATYKASAINSLPAVRLSNYTSKIVAPAGALVEDNHTVFVMLCNIRGTYGAGGTSAVWSQNIGGQNYGYVYATYLTSSTNFAIFTRILDSYDWYPYGLSSPYFNAHQSRSYTVSNSTSHLLSWKWGYSVSTPNETVLLDSQNPATGGLISGPYNPSAADRAFGVSHMAPPARLANRRMTLGNTYDGQFTGALECDVAEMIVYNRVLTDVEMASVRSYFNTKYNLGY